MNNLAPEKEHFFVCLCFIVLVWWWMVLPPSTCSLMSFTSRRTELSCFRHSACLLEILLLAAWRCLSCHCSSRGSIANLHLSFLVIMDSGDAKIELLAAMSELHATMTVALKQLQVVETKMWQYFRLDPPETASSPPKRSASAEAERDAYQKRRRVDSEETLILDAGATPLKVPVHDQVTLTLKNESQPWQFYWAWHGWWKRCLLRSHSISRSLTHSLIWNIVLACELVSEKQNKFRLQVSTCEVLIDHCHALQTVEPLPFQFDWGCPCRISILDIYRP